MCLAVPAQVEKIEGETAVVNLSGNRQKAMASLVPDLKPGDWVLLHAGYILQKIDEKEALETIKLLEEVYGNPEEV